MRPDVAEERHEHEEGDGDPELGFEHGYPSSASSTAALTAESAGTAPLSRSTIAAAASAAIRNPSAADGQFPRLIFGFAVTEALAIFSLLIALLLLYAV